MSTLEYDFSPTSNDLLRRLIANQPIPDLHYQVVAQGADDVQNIENAPAVSMAITRVQIPSGTPIKNQ